MPIFTRRRLQSMLNELAPQLAGSKTQDLVSRIESKQIEQALPAELELGVIWGLGQIGPIEIEPEWYSERTAPDVLSENLFEGHQTIVEIAGLSDSALPGDKGMRNASRKLCQEANKVERGAGEFLSYFFFEETELVDQESIRRICVPESLQITEQIRHDLRSWLVDHDRRASEKLNLRDGGLNVLVEWNEKRQSQFNFRSSMPPEIRSNKKNYVLGVLQRKSKQLRSPLFDGLKCVLLGDVGSTALRRSQDRDPTNRVIHGGQIAQRFLKNGQSDIDVIIILSARRKRRHFSALNETTEWEAEVYSKTEVKLDGVSEFVAALPPPRLEGYQIRQLHEQKAFSPEGRGLYLGTSITGGRGIDTEIRFSSRALLDFLAGRETKERFMRMLGASADSNLFRIQLDRGQTIASIKLEPGGLDEDDDYIVVTFGDDAGAGSLNSEND